MNIPGAILERLRSNPVMEYTIKINVYTINE